MVHICVFLKNGVIEWFEIFPQALKSGFSYAKLPDGSEQNSMHI